MREKRFALSLGLPEDSTGDCARVTLVGQSAALVEGQHGVIELTESRVRLRTGRGVLSVLGEGLRLRELSVDAALIEGHVLTATYAGGRANAMNLDFGAFRPEFGTAAPHGGGERRAAAKCPPRRRAHHARHRFGRAERKAGRALRAVWLADDGGSRGLAASAHPNDEKTMDARRGDAAQRLLGLCLFRR